MATSTFQTFIQCVAFIVGDTGECFIQEDGANQQGQRLLLLYAQANAEPGDTVFVVDNSVEVMGVILSRMTGGYVVWRDDSFPA